MTRAPTVVVLAGGQGRRLLPYTLSVPKPMMPVGGKPILEILVGQLAGSGYAELVFAIGHLGDIIRDHFGDGRAFGVSIRYSAEPSALGTAGPLDLLRDMLDRTFVLVNGDILADFDWPAIVEAHRRNASEATVVLARRDEALDFGVVALDPSGRVASWQEKPGVERLVSAGACVFEPGALERLPRGERTDLPDFVMALVRAGRNVRGHLHPGRWLDIGRPADYERACADAARGAPG
ncbi:MAG: NTP transferase domain-containing protein [Burkholderiales bacterium]|nr:NTP transferase domain-containing protein [Burkholderiales bacterium]